MVLYTCKKQRRIIRREIMSYFILNAVKINEKKNEISIKGGYNNVVPRENSKFELKGETFKDKIRTLVEYALSGEIKMGNLSKSVIKYQYAFIKAKEELNIARLSEYWNALPEQKEEIEEKFAVAFIKYYNEKENEKKYAVVNNYMKYRKIAFCLSGKYLPKDRCFSSYQYAYEENEWDCPEIAFEYKKATVIKNILGDNLYHLEEVGN